MSSNTVLSGLAPNIRRLHDQALTINSKLKPYTSTVRRYSIQETHMKDETKTLLETIENVSMYLDYPGDISNLSSNTPVIEDALPITAFFPWKQKCRDFKIDIKDEFDIILEDEFGTERIHKFKIIDRVSQWEEQHLYRDFVVAPLRVDDADLTDSDDSGTADDPNVEVIRDPVIDILSDYD